ncbi:MAG: hypothetical protein ACTHM5_03775 [Ginsengibacter sp.]
MSPTQNNSFTSALIEEGLKKIQNEDNPFYDGHVSKWGIERDKSEKIGEMMGRWDETIASSKLANELFEFLQNEYFNKIKSEAKQGLIKKHIDSYNQYRINGNSMNFEAGYTNKGFRWFEEQKDFSLRDFILHHPETISDQVYDEAAKLISYPIITEALIENAPKQELYFCYACEGYAYAKYVAFLRDEEIKEKEKPPKKKTTAGSFIPPNFTELFTNPALVDRCIELLREADKPHINDRNEFLSHKGAFVVWFRSLEKKGLLNYSFLNDFERAATLNKNFKGLNISASSFKNVSKKALDNDKDYFETGISVLKH